MSSPNETYRCSSGLILPLTDESGWSTGTRAILYLIGLLYSFVGVAIAADVFMCAIERITSATRKVRIKNPDVAVFGDDASETELYREVRVWNPTVANLTLMALGSSAPEILLSVIEIVGSAAFNLLMITAVCIVSVPGTRRIDAIMVFAVTASFSVFAYIWLLIILMATSEGEVTIVEGLLTLFFFALLVVCAFAADKKICMRFKKRKPETELKDMSGKNDLETDGVEGEENKRLNKGGLGFEADDDPWAALSRGEELSSAQMMELMRQMRLQYPGLSAEECARMLAYRIKMAQPHDRLWYRIQATRNLFADRRRDKWWDKTSDMNIPKDLSVVSLPGVHGKQRVIEFSARVYAVDPEVDKRVRLNVVRRGRNNKIMLFKYVTVNGVAEKHTHFQHKQETLRFEPGQTHKELSVELVAGAEWKPRDVFYVHLELVKEDEYGSKTELGACKVAEVAYLPGDKPEGAANEVQFVKNHAAVEESAGHVRLPVRRVGDYATRCTVSYETEDITAHDGQDYEGGSFEVNFDQWEVEKYVDIGIIDDLLEEKDERFAVQLKDAGSSGRVGQMKTAVVTILSDDGTAAYFRNMDKLLPRMLDRLTPGVADWKEQIMAAISVNAGDLDNASIGDCFSHILAFPWKVIFAFVPPATYAGGWLTFFIALALIGVLTAIVGDLAGIFGCLVGLPPSVTAITFVALGTSLPDTFASRLAALQDPHADNAVGNVTGSNSVNVFLGLGLPWFIAACYWSAQGKSFDVPVGDLGFSVLIFTICSVLCLGLLMLRRYVPFFGRAELGGPTLPKYMSGIFLMFLWIFYILMSAMNSYGSFEVNFDQWEVEKYVDIGIIDDLLEEKDERFAVQLKDAGSSGRVGQMKTAVVTILSDDGTAAYFRNMDKLLPRMLDRLTPGVADWKEQIMAAISVNAGDLDNASIGDCFSHILAFPWKVIFAFVPPATYAGGWLTFFIALALIGVLTAIVGDLAGIFGCLVGLPPSVTAITFVALGTSLPDTFASRLAALQDPHADNAVGNVTGSNSVNVFLGLGLPWFIAACYWSAQGKSFDVPVGDLGFSVLIFTICSVLCLGLLMLRRYVPFFGRAELGGPTLPKYMSGIFLMFLWIFYILMSAMNSYGVL